MRSHTDGTPRAHHVLVGPGAGKGATEMRGILTAAVLAVATMVAGCVDPDTGHGADAGAPCTLGTVGSSCEADAGAAKPDALKPIDAGAPADAVTALCSDVCLSTEQVYCEPDGSLCYCLPSYNRCVQ